ncbi:MAG TPA: excinuclease ABC subunit UvrA [Burkholderiales bacterium]|nr:excinuclease ABC subunit UvrA [Burkholderiales bacterium]
MKRDSPVGDPIVIRGARQNNLKNLSLSIPTGELTVVTGVSGSGKSSLVFDTLYAEGQRRYVETFSPYARQFLDRMDKPQVDAIEGIPPAIAIDQTNPVRTSRSTVGTMTELNDHLKLLYARAAALFCRGCGRQVVRDTPESIYAQLLANAQDAGDPTLIVTFPVPIPQNFSEKEVLELLQKQGYTRIHARSAGKLEVLQDRVRAAGTEKSRVMEALESALRVGQGRVNVYAEGKRGQDPLAAEKGPDPFFRFSSDLHCPHCDLHYADPIPAAFSFNSPIGACETCRGFGRVIGVDFGLVLPDESKTLRGGAVKPWQTKSFKECHDDLIKYAKKRGIALDTPWRELSAREREWVLEGEREWVSWSKSWPGIWYGVRRFFKWLESKAYKMHIRVLLSKYRAYTECSACGGTRLKPDSTLWKLGPQRLSIHDFTLLPIERAREHIDRLELPAPLDQATELLLGEIRARLRYLCEVGLGYLTLDRQSRTLSGGEVQRINLTTALGTSLVNTLFVLDEPSIGLHPRDMGRVIEVMQRLRNAGNSLVVVEHDPQIMHAADRILDMGPGPGERGGTIVFSGTPADMRGAHTLTADYLCGRKRVDEPRNAPPARSHLSVLGASANNLKDVDVSIPLERLVCVTGVSGSGKSTLVQDVLYAALRKAKGKPTEQPGPHRRLIGADHVGDAVLVDQSPIGKTTRSNPASYVGAFDCIRDLFARAPLARERKYTAGTFSFNSGNGRCPVCGGNGFEHVEMQFLSDVYLRCPECDGKRYRAEALEVQIRGKSIADVLEMTVSEATVFFADEKDVLAKLQPLADVGLEYLRLGQPVPTLSGGEAQRLKLAGHLCERKKNAKQGFVPILFLFDEPTTGLHFDDIAKLLRAFWQLLQAGHSLVVIEHNLDVIRASDWIIDLGPEGGEAGGEIVCVGTPADVTKKDASHTGRALREYEASFALPPRSAAAMPAADPRSPQASARVSEPNALYLAEAIRIHNAREHNLRNIDVSIPRNRFNVITGVSGSGKSTLAFDILFAEGQRRYLESLNAYARQFVQAASRPDVDAIYGIPPTVAIEQRTSRGGSKSTVGTLTEVHHFLRLLFVKLGTQHCPDCNVPIEPQSEDAIAARLMREYKGQRIGLLAPLVVNRKGVYTDLAKWAKGKGYTHLRIDGAFLPVEPFPRIDRFKEHTIELPVADLRVRADAESELRAGLAKALEFGKGIVMVLSDLDDLVRSATKGKPLAMRTQTFSTKRACPSCGRSFAEPDPRLFSYNSRHGWCPSCFGTGLQLKDVEWDEERERTGTEDNVLDSWIEWLEVDEPCPQCHGQRLNPEALAVRWRDQSIAQYGALPVEALAQLFESLELQGRERDIARDLVAELRSRLGFLREVGLSYLSLDRSAPTLSGGEAQRIRLAAQLGSNLRGVCYILDEPTIGLHHRDNQALLGVLERLEAKGNTLVVVEHDEDTIRRAHHVIDLGPGAGRLGGEVIAQGSAEELMLAENSLTGRFLANPLLHPLQPRRKIDRKTESLTIEGASLHNLKQVNARIPLGRLVVVTGVSGSGKSTLARDVLYTSLQSGEAIGCKALKGRDAVERVLEVDQTPIGKTPRSCPATYVGFWDQIRKLFADTSEARMRGWSASRFSFNTSGGRCESCEGQGLKKIEMSFLPDVRVGCEGCGGQRFNPETLSVRWRGKSIGDVLSMSVDEAVEFFAAHPKIHHCLRLLQDVGLGYLTLGQQSPTLSGGESQRIKLVTELAKVRTDTLPLPNLPRGRKSIPNHTLYVLDEPTVGLHMADVEKLLRVLHRLVDAGNTAVVIEHNLDVIAEADWVIDLGPEGGNAGGEIVMQAPPEDAGQRDTHTARALSAFLAERSVAA